MTTNDETRKNITRLVTDMTVDKKLSEEFLIDELIAFQEQAVLAARIKLVKAYIEIAESEGNKVAIGHFQSDLKHYAALQQASQEGTQE